ncbi:MAG: FAD-binding protein [Defluviitaleaceae bacterium]|nr:FAD-binding protein [Defluviitaleaceae bacterium]
MTGIEIDITKYKIHSYNTVIVGSGAAAFNAANSLYELGVKNIAVVTEGMNKGTSRNTGSDKQTYYKMSTSGADGDSPYKMAETLFNGGAMHGDIALVEAALSTMSFYNLKRIGVPFPTDRYAQHIGYKTDHDPYTRASSAGPLTSKYMTECLERQIKLKDIDIFDNYQVISVVKDGEEAAGLLAINLTDINEEDYGFTLFNSTNVIYCTGGPSCIYYSSVFPKSHFGGTGAALEAGVSGINLTEWQYGMASTKFRWNVSGTYQQVLPRYVSTDENMGDERDFLCDYFKSFGQMNDAVFLKGYQWPFDSRKMDDFASSTIDILVYIETQIKGRRVFLDYTKNPSYPGTAESELFTALSKESYDYLANSDALFGTPIERLMKMNPLAIDLYRTNGIDITTEYLEIDVCAQHNNGGLLGDIWWQSNVAGFFPVGEVCGTMGVYRPGGSALNSTQTGGARAALYISKRRKSPPRSLEAFMKAAEPAVKAKLAQAKSVNLGDKTNIMDIRIECQKTMTKFAAFFRAADGIREIMPDFSEKIKSIFEKSQIVSVREISEVFRNYDMLICQYTYLSAMAEYAKKGGQSRGSYVIIEDDGEYSFDSEKLKFKYSIDNKLSGTACVSTYDKVKGTVSHRWDMVRPIPADDSWFENVWSDYRNDKFYY